MLSSFIVAGDIHGRIEHVSQLNQLAIRLNITDIIQVGDFGMYWPGGSCPLRQFFYKRSLYPEKPYSKVHWHIVPGNHDVYAKYSFEKDPLLANIAFSPYGENNVTFYPRNYELKLLGYKFLFFGGAVSSDSSRRKVNKTWWAREAPSREEYEKFMDLIENKSYDYIVTHDTPLDIWCIPTTNTLHMPQRSSLEVSQFLQIALSNAKCKAWFHGHRHLLGKRIFKDIAIYGTGLHGQGVLMNPFGKSQDYFISDSQMFDCFEHEFKSIR